MIFGKRRHDLVDKILVPKGIEDKKVIAALKKVQRHLFVEPALQNQAYQDCTLPIGLNQTISQPFTVALMTQLLELKGDEKILEIGTGSGYQTAILAELSKKVYSVEKLPQLTIRARKILENLGYYTINIKTGDGTLGWKDHSPYDAIILTASGPNIPQMLLEQLSEKGGRLIAPVGTKEKQELIFVRRSGKEFIHEIKGDANFVPLIGEFGWK